jgi:hypothetical protein
MLRAAVVLLTFALLTSAAHAEKRIALLIGNKDYVQAVGPLKTHTKTLPRSPKPSPKSDLP